MKKFAAVLLALATLVPAVTFAQDTAAVGLYGNAGVSTGVGSTSVRAEAKAGVKAEVKATATATRIADAKARADREIDRRIKALTELTVRINALARVSADFKASLAATLQGQITSLTNLKATIDAESSTTTLKTDIQSIAQSYRVFMLVIPVSRVAAAADRVNTIAGMMTTLGAKLNARIDAAKTAGNETAAWVTLMADFSAKVSDAQTQAAAAVNATVALQPDNGDKTVAASNEAALKTARADLKAAQTDLKAAREDVRKVLQGLKVTGSASTTVSH